MRLGHVLGTVTLGQLEPALRGGRFLLVQPFGPLQFAGAPAQPLARGATLVVYDALGAGTGQVVGFTEGSEAAMPFAADTPVDAYCAAIVEEIFYQPPR